MYCKASSEQGRERQDQTAQPKSRKTEALASSFAASALFKTLEQAKIVLALAVESCKERKPTSRARTISFQFVWLLKFCSWLGTNQSFLFRLKFGRLGLFAFTSLLRLFPLCCSSFFFSFAVFSFFVC